MLDPSLILGTSLTSFSGQKGTGWHSFKRFRKTWLRGARCLEDINNFWMAHKPQTMSEVEALRFECGGSEPFVRNVCGQKPLIL